MHYRSLVYDSPSGLLNNSNAAVSKKIVKQYKGYNNHHTIRFQDKREKQQNQICSEYCALCITSTEGKVVAWGTAPLVVAAVAVGPAVVAVEH